MGAILDRLKGILDRSRQLGPLAEPIRQILWNANRDRALQGIDAEGLRIAGYAPLLARTLKDRKRRGYAAGPPLVRKGLESELIRGCIIIVSVGNGQLRFTKYWEAPWMAYHITGTSHMKQRNIAGYSKEEIEAARKLLPAHILGIGDLPGSVIGRPV